MSLIQTHSPAWHFSACSMLTTMPQLYLSFQNVTQHPYHYSLQRLMNFGPETALFIPLNNIFPVNCSDGTKHKS